MNKTFKDLFDNNYILISYSKIIRAAEDAVANGTEKELLIELYLNCKEHFNIYKGEILKHYLKCNYSADIIKPILDKINILE